MRSGLMRERVAFQAKTETVSSAGIVSATWATAFTCWARVKQYDAKADEAEIADRVAAQQRLVIIIRHRADVTSTMRATWRGRVFEIEGLVNRDERRRFLDVHVIERKAP